MVIGLHTDSFPRIEKDNEVETVNLNYLYSMWNLLYLTFSVEHFSFLEKSCWQLFHLRLRKFYCSIL